jgi:hypothetical protein
MVRSRDLNADDFMRTALGGYVLHSEPRAVGSAPSLAETPPDAALNICRVAKRRVSPSQTENPLVSMFIVKCRVFYQVSIFIIRLHPPGRTPRYSTVTLFARLRG